MEKLVGEKLETAAVRRAPKLSAPKNAQQTVKTVDSLRKMLPRRLIVPVKLMAVRQSRKKEFIPLLQKSQVHLGFCKTSSSFFFLFSQLMEKIPQSLMVYITPFTGVENERICNQARGFILFLSHSPFRSLWKFSPAQ
ncbi:unnamed protein product [Eretmochelys imbricata]